MKKSYDYFKMFKILSEAVSVIYQKSISKEDYSSNRITFFAGKTELINNLRDEFITPFERGDIFLLEESLTDELDSIFALQDYLSLIIYSDYVELESTAESLKSQYEIFSQFDKFKSNIRLFEKCSQEIKKLNVEKKRIEKHIVEAIKCKNEQPLLKYAVYSVFLDLNRKIFKTILEIEKILINNS